MRTGLTTLLLASLAAAQTPPPPPAPALHRGWLSEILDGDRERAARLYAEAHSDDTAPLELRAVALARLVELERLEAESQDLDRLVRELRDVFEELDMPQPPGFRFGGQPIPTEGLVEAARLGEEELQNWFDQTIREAYRDRRRGSSRPFDTRPWVSPVYVELVDKLAQARSTGNDPVARRFVRDLTQLGSRRFFRRGNIVEILKLTLNGQFERAARLRRSVPRALRRQVSMPADPVAALEVARTRLDGELARIGLNPEERRALRRLQERLAELTPEDATEAIVLERATEAVNLLRSLPVYGELLLGNR